MEKPKVKYLKDYKVPEYLIDETELYVSLDENITSIKTTLKIRKNPESSENSKTLVLNGEDIELKVVHLNNKTLDKSDYSVDEKLLKIPNVPDEFELTIVNTLHPETNTSLEGLYKSKDMFCTQCEAEGFRKITYFIDRPDVLSVFTCTIEADIYKYPVLLSNGNKVREVNLLNGRHCVTWHDPFRKPCYLFALVVGDLKVKEDVFTTVSGKKVELKIYVEPENIDKCDYAMESLKKAMKWDEEVYGREYDLDIYMIVAVNDFNMGAMENKGLNIFNSKYVLAKPETATDSDFDGIESVIAHEYFHNWTGNRITLKNWFQLSLKEGLTVFRDQEFSADMHSPAVERIKNVRNLILRQFPEDAGPMAHPVRPESYIEMNNFYTMTVYEKGAEVIRMIQTIVGKDNFFKGMDLYFERFDGQAVTIEDFVSVMEEASDTDLTQFKLWYSQAGTPEIEFTEDYDFENQEYKLTLKQHIPDTINQKNKKPMHIPISIGLLNEKGMEIHKKILHLREKSQSFVFKNVSEKPVLSILRNFSAPVKLKTEENTDKLVFLALKDTDKFNRWNSIQKLYSKIILNEIKQNNAEYDLLLNPVKSLLENAESDPLFIVEMLKTPRDTEIWNQLEIIDVEKTFKAAEYLKKFIAVNFEKELNKLYTRFAKIKISDKEKAKQIRALKNHCLLLLNFTEDKKYLEYTYNQFENSDNMTDIIASLNILTHTKSEEKETAFNEFYEKWKTDELVMDKWFALQAISKNEDTLEKVINLIEHELFSIKNPNRVRALIGTFCSENTINFHRKTGEGYQLLTETVITLNEINPQIAARLVSVFNRWTRFDETRKRLMKNELVRIKNIDNLSDDVFEIVNRALSMENSK